MAKTDCIIDNKMMNIFIYWLFSWKGAFTNAKEDCKSSFCDIQLLFQSRKNLTLCFSTNQKKCFLLNCSCSDTQYTGHPRQSSETLKCTTQNNENVEIQDPHDENEEVTNTPDSTTGNRNIQSTTMKSDGPEKGSIFRFYDRIMGEWLER